MNLGKIAALYSIIVGIVMIGMWIMLFITNQIPELATEPIEMSMTLFVEFLTAGILIIGGFGLFTKYKWGFQLWLISMGMLMYTLINSAGYSAQRNEFAMIGMFTILTLLAVVFLGLSFLKKDQF